MDKRANLEGHLKICQDEIARITAEFTDKENLPFKTLMELNNRYANVITVGNFIASMINQMFPAKIVTPPLPDRMKIIN